MVTPDRYNVTLITEDQEALGPIQGHIEAPKSAVVICDDPSDPTRAFWLAQPRSFLRCERLRDGRTEAEWAALAEAAEVLARQNQAAESAQAEHQARVEREEAERQQRAAEGPVLTEEERAAEWKRRLEESKAKKAPAAEGVPPPPRTRKPT